MDDTEATEPHEFYLDSSALAICRQFLKLAPELRIAFGPIAQFRLVIDANIAISDLVRKHNYPEHRQTAIEEAVSAGVFELFAPTWLDTEMTGSTIPQVAKRRRVPEDRLLELWGEYRKQITWDETYASPDGFYVQDGDIKDMPYVALQQSIAAVAILSNDKDIEKLGGKRVSFEFVLSARTYARAASYSIGIRLGGPYIAVISATALYRLVKGAGALIAKLPDWAKISLLVLAVAAIVHPGSRERIFRFLETSGGVLAATWPKIDNAIMLASEKEIEAKAALQETEGLLSA